MMNIPEVTDKEVKLECDKKHSSSTNDVLLERRKSKENQFP